MLGKYQMKTPSRVYAGIGVLDEVTRILEQEKPAKVALLTDKGIVETGLHSIVLDRILAAGISVVLIDDIPSEPEYHAVEDVVAKFNACNADFIIALGGGSVMDVAKLASVLVDGSYSVVDLLKTPSLAVKSISTLMIPTTCGTGSEATCNAIVLVPEDEMKVGIVSDAMIADYVVLDPETIRNLPRRIAASTALDALCHAIECYTGNKANPFSDTFSLKALELMFSSMEKAVMSDDMNAKEDMLLASFLAGAAITSSGTTAIHALSYPLGGRFHIPHGIGNAMLLAPVIRFNAPSCMERLAAIGARFFPEDGSGVEGRVSRLVGWLEHVVESFDIPSLSDFGVSEDDLRSLAEDGLAVHRLMDNNPRQMNIDEAVSIYEEAL